MTHDSGNCVLQNGGSDHSDGDDDNDEGDQEFHGNPGVHIVEIGDDGQPIPNDDAEAENVVPDVPIGDEINVDEALSDIDPNHNALMDSPVNSGDLSGSEMVLSSARWNSWQENSVKEKSLVNRVKRLGLLREGNWIQKPSILSEWMQNQNLRVKSEPRWGRYHHQPHESWLLELSRIGTTFDSSTPGGSTTSNPFSWVGKRQKEIIESCLDRVFINSEWQGSFPVSETEFLPIAGSDHAPVIIDIEEEVCVKRGQFRYDKRYAQTEDFVEAVQRGWQYGKTDDHGGIQDKLRVCRRELAKWKRKTRTNSAEKIQALKYRIDAAERDHLVPLSTVSQLRRDLNQAYRDEEVYWHLKSRNKWMLLGDRNTKFFHATTKVRKSRNRIKSIMDDQGIEHFQDDAIGKVAEAYFTNLFSTSQYTDLEETIADIEPKVTEQMNRDLLRPVTDLEIRDAVFAIGADRAPGFDGFTAAFYQQFWDLISSDVCSMVRHFFESDKMDHQINQTQICLIPKTEDAKHMADYRPISLCTVSYKIISKIMIMRLKQCLGFVISDSQAAFVPGRNITDNILVAHELLHSLKSRRECQISYEVLINGSPYGKITPSRGLRQGDPLSPYLFLFCAEVLSHMLCKAEYNKQIHGMQLTRNCPSISHLLFADDSLFFCRATRHNVEQLATIFKRYEEASGQKINYTKSSMIFGQKIPDLKRQRLHRILGIYNVGGGGKYLGLPEQFGRKKVELFEYIVKKVKERTEGWTYKYLSPAGKEIVIKAIAMALPVYSMNCFLLPTTICNEINSVVTSFWWGQENGRRKIPWVAWKRMTLPKKEGGLGFKDLHEFNRALLAKQSWRILTNPSCLLARLYKGLYYPNNTYLKAKDGYQASYGWKSVQEGKILLQQGLRARIGNGQSIKIWEDPWLPTLPPRPANGPALIRDLKVADLWIDGKREWDPIIFEGVLNPEDQQLAKTLYLSNHADRDTFEWAYTNNTRYTVRSGYWVATHVNVPEEEKIQPPDGDLGLKQEVWKLQITPKIKHFLWRCLAGALSTTTQLRTRNISADPICQRCCYEEETINHIMFTCPYAQVVWRSANVHMGSPVIFTDNLEDNIRLMLQYQKKTKTINNGLQQFWIMWRLWKSRNEFLFQKLNRFPWSVAQKGLKEANEWIEANGDQTENSLRNNQNKNNPVARRNQQWSPPPVGWVKCNFDSGYVQGRDHTSSGWIIRDSTGRVILSGCTKLQQSYSALQAEALGFLHALQVIWVHGFRHVYFEGDNLQLTTLINKIEDHHLIGTLLQDIRVWMAKLPLSSLGHVNREANVAADKLSRYATTMTNLYQIFNVPPRWLSNCV
ncbi:Ribonuclease H domain [Arabidopsis suecica]|uniref:Ribonuclease H domain n=1 Tax=Arabidopsis suecica TaxID=45249 RepID=A0A8T1ZFB3_ARASU|nr:Ribonuclease H domain [Arabidopsis suecica]